jgi:hypothetical protein
MRSVTDPDTLRRIARLVLRVRIDPPRQGYAEAAQKPSGGEGGHHAA